MKNSRKIIILVIHSSCSQLLKRAATIFLFLISSFLLSQSNYDDQSLKEFKSNLINKYSSNGESKAEGLKIHFKYPRSWESLEGDRPHIVRKFIQPDNFASAVIFVNKMENEISQKFIDSALTNFGLKKMVPKFATFISCNPNLKIEGIKAGSIEYEAYVQLVDKINYVHILQYILFYKEYLIIFTFSVGDKSEFDNVSQGKDVIDKRYKTIYPLFWEMFNSVVIDNVWQK